MCLVTYIIIYLVNRSAVLTPSEISACSGEEIEINCYESDSNTYISGLQWEIAPASRYYSILDVILSITQNESQRQEYGLQFHFEFISYSPLIARLITTAHPVLNGATVSCAASPTSMDTLTISVLETGNVNFTFSGKLTVTESASFQINQKFNGLM